MAIRNNKVEELIQEGIELSFDVISGIRSEKKKKMMTVVMVLAVVLVLLVVVLCITGHPVYAIPLGIAGGIGLGVLLYYNNKQLEGLRKELDTLYHYLNF